MDNVIKKTLRKSKFVLRFYWALKRVLIFPLRFTSLRILDPMKIPFKDYFDFKKLSLFKIVKPYTKAGYPRLVNVYNLSNEIEKKKISGSFVECGTWKGGCLAIMGAVSQRYDSKRKIWYLDSFEGMPDEASEYDGDNTDRLKGDVLRASMEDVEEIVFNKLNLKRENNIIVKGWFQETLPKIKNKIGPIAILRMDADWYDATIYCLRELYDQVVDGGYIIFDDYDSWEGCNKAVDELIKEKNLNVKFQYISNMKSGVMFFKKN